MGDEAEADALARQGIAVAVEVGAPHGVAFAWYYTAQLYVMAGDADTVLTWSERAIAHCEEHGLAGVMGWCRVFRGWAIAELGRPDEAIADMAAAAASRAAGSRINVPVFHGLLADVEARRGTSTPRSSSSTTPWPGSARTSAGCPICTRDARPCSGREAPSTTARAPPRSGPPSTSPSHTGPCSSPDAQPPRSLGWRRPPRRSHTANRRT